MNCFLAANYPDYTNWSCGIVPLVGDLKEVTIYTDGGAIGNPGPGGYGVVLICGKHRKEVSGGYRLTTNNRMELLAVITGLEALKSGCRVMIFSDSQYVVNAVEKGWAMRWRANNWRRNKKEKAVNPDLWERLLRLCECHQVKFKWVRGHTGNKENERCDELVREAAGGADLAVDIVYEETAGASNQLVPGIGSACSVPPRLEAFKRSR